MINNRKLCKICDCKDLCTYLGSATNSEWLDCEDIRELVIEIIEKNLPEEEEE